MNSGKANIYLRNIATSIPTKFENTAEHPKYIVITRAQAAMSHKDEFVNCINDNAPCFKDNDVITLRFGNLLTVSNVGNYLLGVGYASMDAIEKTYDDLLAHSSYKKLMTFAKVNMRNIFRIL